MAFDWTKYLALARELAARSEEEALRTAISRAYYAAFGMARARLEQEGVTFLSDGNVHTAVWNNYRDAREDIRQYIGIDGVSLRNARNAADYDGEFPDLQRRAQNAVNKADNVLRSLNRL